MRAFVVYTAARAGLFLAVYGLIWLVFGRWIDWNSLSALYTALIAMLISAVISMVALRSLRGDLADHVSARAERARAAHRARVHSDEDD